jgi:hypothetical protein
MRLLLMTLEVQDRVHDVLEDLWSGETAVLRHVTDQNRRADCGSWR